VKPASFDYVRPRTIAEALAAVSDGSTGARILAGGQSLVPMLNLRLSSATLLVDIRQISELRQATESVDTVIFGACVRHAEIEDGVVPDPAIGMMRHVARHLAYRAVRNRGTIGGSVALADPSADWLTVLHSLGATYRVEGPAGERTIATDGMFSGPYTTALASSDILTAIVVPKLTRGARWGYYKVIRKAGEYPVTIASVVIDPGRRLYSVVLGGNDREPLRLKLAADTLLEMRHWPADVENRLRRAIRADFAAADRGETFYQAKLAETAVLRAANKAIG
jgi:aerobic carbon-monoxide dehydrogenase medium subunit